MSLSDSRPENSAEWHPLDPEKVACATPAPEPDEAFYEFKMLYGTTDPESPAAAFMPLYGREHDQQPVDREGTDADQQPDESEPAPDPEEIRKKAYEEGFAEGEKKGFAARKEDAVALVNRLDSLLTDMEGIWKQLVGAYEKQMIQLICRMSEKVVFGHIKMDHEVVKRAIFNALKMIPEPVDVSIEVNPEDAEYIETIKEDFFSHLKTLKHISVISNPSITRGGCAVKTIQGEVDATLESRLEAIRDAVIQAGGNKRKRGHSPKS
jgi:flagellar assembly protein FliH